MEKLRVGIIGAGNIAGIHLNSYMKNPNVKVEVICDIDSEKPNQTSDGFFDGGYPTMRLKTELK